MLNELSCTNDAWEYLVELSEVARRSAGSSAGCLIAVSYATWLCILVYCKTSGNFGGELLNKQINNNVQQQQQHVIAVLSLCA
ncbi:unnamed protein product [Ceratitis capitata]|uniref:(Mediterranean fruit fly) hypothetical protein n=1 Tax=Ceratitis capitata TaxID=7213 RepID=A0A811UTZ9_CERCA|nr:unnamed protein product [Ceratitis capitata]